MPMPIISDFEKQRRENAIRSASIDKPNHLSNNFNDPSRVYLRDNKRTVFIRNQDNETVSSEDTEEDDDLEDDEDERNEHDENTSPKDIEEDHDLNEGHGVEDEHSDDDNNMYKIGTGVPNQATKTQSVSSDSIKEDNSEIEADYMELFDEESDEDDENSKDEEDIGEEILDEVKNKHSMTSGLLNEGESEIRTDYMELDDDDVLLDERSDPGPVLHNSPSNASSTDDDRYPLGLAPPTSGDLSCFSVHNLQLILGIPKPDDRLFNANDELPEHLHGFIHGLIPSHAQEPVLDYFRMNFPISICEQLNTLIPSTPQVVQKELAILITEISSHVAVAAKDTTIHVGVLFKRSDILVQWLTSLTPQTIKLLVGVSSTGQELVDIISTWYVRVNCSSAPAHGDNYIDIGIEYHEREFPRDLPTEIKNLLSRLSVDFEQEVIDLIINLPPRIRVGFAAVLGLAPPRIINIILNVLEQCGLWHTYDAGTEESALETEHLEPFERNSENSGEETTIVDPYNEIREADNRGALFSFLVGLPDEVFAPVWPMQNAGYHLCHMIARCIVAFDTDGHGSGPSTETIARSANFRLGLLPAAPIITTDSVRRIISSLAPIPTEELGDDQRECPICTKDYCDPGLGSEEEREVAKRLPCGHMFGDACLVILLGEKIRGGFEHRSCPMCRAPLTDFLKNS